MLKDLILIYYSSFILYDLIEIVRETARATSETAANTSVIVRSLIVVKNSRFGWKFSELSIDGPIETSITTAMKTYLPAPSPNLLVTAIYKDTIRV